MAATKSTFSLDARSVHTLERLAKRWQVSKTEVVRRAIRKAEETDTPTVEERLAALRSLQNSMERKKVDFEAWKKVIRDGRR